jgi:hypothetical protein
MLRVHTWRANAVLHALDLLAGVPPGSRRERTISGILDEVVHGFQAEARLAGVSLRTELRGDLASSEFNEEDLRAVLASALLASLPIAERAAERTLTLRISSAAGGAVAFDILLPGVALPRYLAAHFFDVELADDRPGGHPASIGALAARMFAARHNGTAAFEPFERGYRLTITLPRKS